MDQLKQYCYLMRLDKPIGILLLLWPTLWAVFLAVNGRPSNFILFVFVFGVILMRSAGCIINDIADRKFDAFVERTRERPLATRKLKVKNALLLFGLLCLVALGMVLLLNRLTHYLAVVGVLLTLVYPFLKRFTQWPQLGLGLAFAWGVPMAFAAQLNTVPLRSGLVFFAAAIWPVMYDTIYALVDRSDDITIGVKSTAILFGDRAFIMIAGMQGLCLVTLIMMGLCFNLNYLFFLSLLLVAGLFSYQLWLIHDMNRELCFKAFLNNHWVGLVIFLGIYVGLK